MWMPQAHVITAGWKRRSLEKDSRLGRMQRHGERRSSGPVGCRALAMVHVEQGAGARSPLALQEVRHAHDASSLAEAAVGPGCDGVRRLVLDRVAGGPARPVARRVSEESAVGGRRGALAQRRRRARCDARASVSRDGSKRARLACALDNVKTCVECNARATTCCADAKAGEQVLEQARRAAHQACGRPAPAALIIADHASTIQERRAWAAAAVASTQHSDTAQGAVRDSRRTVNSQVVIPRVLPGPFTSG